MFVYFIFPETYGRTLEELTFRKLLLPLHSFSFELRGILKVRGKKWKETKRVGMRMKANGIIIVFEDKDLTEQANAVVEKQLHAADHVISGDQDIAADQREEGGVQPTREVRYV